MLGIAQIDPKTALDKRVTRLNDLFADRRPEAYFLTTDLRKA